MGLVNKSTERHACDRNLKPQLRLFTTFLIDLKEQVHGLAHVHESNNFLSDLLVILSVNNPTHLYLSDHIL